MMSKEQLQGLRQKERIPHEVDCSSLAARFAAGGFSTALEYEAAVTCEVGGERYTATAATPTLDDVDGRLWSYLPALQKWADQDDLTPNRR